MGARRQRGNVMWAGDQQSQQRDKGRQATGQQTSAQTLFELPAIMRAVEPLGDGQAGQRPRQDDAGRNRQRDLELEDAERDAPRAAENRADSKTRPHSTSSPARPAYASPPPE